MTRGFEPVSDKHKKHLIAVKCPQKATKDSVAYDFYTPVDLVIPPQEKVTVYSDIKAYMEPGVVLILVPRRARRALSSTSRLPILSAWAKAIFTTIRTTRAITLSAFATCGRTWSLPGINLLDLAVKLYPSRK